MSVGGSRAGEEQEEAVCGPEERKESCVRETGRMQKRVESWDRFKP